MWDAYNAVKACSADIPHGHVASFLSASSLQLYQLWTLPLPLVVAWQHFCFSATANAILCLFRLATTPHDSVLILMLGTGKDACTKVVDSGALET